MTFRRADYFRLTPADTFTLYRQFGRRESQLKIFQI
nr:unnamed protein product [Callosobruchus analis]CAI5867034.1 unnamed protein product [Callosobruchus analis]